MSLPDRPDANPPFFAMIFFRGPHQRSLCFLCCFAIALFSGCATAPAPAPKVTVERPRAPASVPPPIKTEAPASAPNPVSPQAESVPTVPAVVAPPVIPAGRATIKGSQETSLLLDNFTAFVATVDGKKIEAGRGGWNIPLEIEAGHRILDVEFNRGVFVARAKLELEATTDAQYELKYATDAELFGHNSYCNFWIVDHATGQTVTPVAKTSVEKMAEVPGRPVLR
jgi:hypothetical protein